MLLNRSAIQTARNFAANGLYSAPAQKLMNATVELVSGGAPFFVGSGVILGTGKEVAFDTGTQKWKATTTKFTVIVSALHNLYINADKVNKIPPLAGSAVTWDQNYATRFASEVKIRYGPAPLIWGGDPTGSAVINRVLPVFSGNIGQAGKMISVPASASSDGQLFQLVNLNGATNADGSKSGGPNDGVTPLGGTEAASWDYDMVLLLSKDATLYNYATSGDCSYMGTKTLKDLGAELLPSWSDGAGKYKVPVLGRNYRLMQLGYGLTSDPAVAVKVGVGTVKLPTADPPLGMGVPAVPAPVYQKLQYKRSLPKAASTTDFYINTEFKLPDTTSLVLKSVGGMLLDCNGGNNSTFSGDSGGPMAAFPVAGGAEAYLVGVNSGAGVAASEVVARIAPGAQGSVWEYDNNAVTSLGLLYSDLYDLRFQNV